MSQHLTSDDKVLLEALTEGGPTDAADLADALDRPRESVDERLVEMQDNALVKTDDDGRYVIADSGRRVLEAPADGSADQRVDVPDDVAATLDQMDLKADEADALRNLYAFLRYWGDATPAEFVDAVRSEVPLGYDSATAWWDEFARDRLAALPDCEPPVDPDGRWRYAETPTVVDDGIDGRVPLGDARGSVRHAIAELDVDDDCREAIRAAFGTLWRRGGDEAADVRTELFDQWDAGYDDAERWWDECVEPGLAALPGIEQTADEGAWRYVDTDGGEAVRPSDAARRSDEPGEATNEAAENAGEDAENDEGCPVCGRPYDGRVYIDTAETVLPGSSLRTCVRAAPDADTAEIGLTLYYHRRSGESAARP